MARLTLLRAKEALANRCPPDKLEYRLNRVCERLILNGKWVGSLQTIAIAAPFGQIALPPQYRTIEGVRVLGRALEIFPKWYSWMPGYGSGDDRTGFSMEAVRDLGDNYATMYALPIGGSKYTSAPTVVITGDGTGASATAIIADNQMLGRGGSPSNIGNRVVGVILENPGQGDTNATVSFTGGGGNGAEALAVISGGYITDIRLISGGNLTLSYPGIESLTMTVSGTDINYIPQTITITGNTTVSNPFTHIDRVHTEITDVTMTLFHTDANGIITNLAIMAPGDEENLIRRYIIDTLRNQSQIVVEALVKVRHREFTSDQDILPIDNISALSLGLDALQFEDQNAMDVAEKYWEKSIDVLNSELDDDISRTTDPAIRFIYPGKTAPKLTSHY
jgi:hypothetical protein